MRVFNHNTYIQWMKLPSILTTFNWNFMLMWLYHIEVMPNHHFDLKNKIRSYPQLSKWSQIQKLSIGCVQRVESLSSIEAPLCNSDQKSWLLIYVEMVSKAWKNNKIRLIKLLGCAIWGYLTTTITSNGWNYPQFWPFFIDF